MTTAYECGYLSSAHCQHICALILSSDPMKIRNKENPILSRMMMQRYRNIIDYEEQPHWCSLWEKVFVTFRHNKIIEVLLLMWFL